MTATGEQPLDVLVAEDVWGPALDALSRRVVIERKPDLWSDAAQLRAGASRARALIVRNRADVTRELLEASPRLEVVGRAGAGLDNVDVAAATELGITVVAARAANARSVAEHAFALALSLARKIPMLDSGLRAGRWERRHGRELAGLTWGLLGSGSTGMEVARLARCFEMQVVAYDPYVSPDDPSLSELGIRLLDLQQAVSGSDVLSLHLPLTTETRGLISEETLSWMRPDAYLVNVSRGEIVDEHALLKALDDGRLGGAGLDVRAEEPPEPGPLEKRHDVVLSPHVAGLTTAAQDRVVTAVATGVESVLNGLRPENAVNQVSERQ
jgi:D-3-phosphoglycerate dehydrogenase / 2-oxoglutarate reductase